jgi:Spy/CpxP family protein refolding chaperone
MKGRFNLKLAALCAILSVMLIAPALVQAKDSKGAEYYKKHKEEIIKQLKLAPDKEKAVMAVEDKYAAKRQETIAGLKKTKEDLTAALAAPNPDEAKVKELVSALTSGMDSLFNSFKSQRDEELAQMTPVEQGKYLLALGHWRHEMMEKSKKKGAKEPKK